MSKRTFKAKLLHRRRIDQLLAGIFDVPLLVLLSSMGYGKTTAVRQFLNSQKHMNYCWFPLCTDEDDGEWMWRKFCHSLEEVNGELAKSLAEYGLPKNNVDRERILGLFKNSLTEPLIMVIDDYHENKSPEMDQLITYLAKAAVKDLHLMLISRFRPKLSVEELALKGYCLQIAQDQFAFNESETAQLFLENGFSLSAHELEALHENNEGWAAAIYLSLLRYAEDGRISDIKDITRLIKTAVFDKFDLEVQTILIKLSLLDAFDLKGAVYVTGNPKAGKIILNLANNHCFIRYDAKNEAYVIHAILKAVLQELLAIDDLDREALLTRCGDWCRENKSVIEAISFYTASRNYEGILAVFDRPGSTKYFLQAPQIVIRAFQEMPGEVKWAYPYAYLTYVYCYLVRYNSREGARMFYEAKGYYEAQENLGDKDRIMGEIALIESFLHYNDLSGMIHYHKKACLNFAGSSSRIAYHSIVTFGAPHVLFHYHKDIGKLREKTELLEKDACYYIQAANGCGTGFEYTAWAEYYLETGDLDKAELFAHKGILKARTRAQTSLVICATLCLARVSALKGKRPQACALLEGLRSEVEASRSSIMLDSYDIALSELYGILGYSERIPQWLQERDIDQCAIYRQGSEVIYRVMCMGAALRRSYRELEIIAETMGQACRTYNYLFGHIYAGIYDAIAKYYGHSPGKAAESLQQAIDLAMPDGIVTPFAENLGELAPVLEEIQGIQKSEWLKKVYRLGGKHLMPAAPKDRPNPIEDNSAVRLSRRESDVLALIGEGYKQAEIAKELCLSPNTVRRHLQNVYKKLEVDNKVMALKKAGKLNILP